MKRLFLFPALFCALTLHAQTEKQASENFVITKPSPVIVDDKKEVWGYADDPAEFPGGVAAMKKYLSENMVYPQSAVDKNLQGKCYLKFVVSKTGKISNVVVQRGVPNCPECDAESVRVIKGMPDWKPGKMNGEPVNSFFNLPISFKLPEPEPVEEPKK